MFADLNLNLGLTVLNSLFPIPFHVKAVSQNKVFKQTNSEMLFQFSLYKLYQFTKVVSRHNNNLKKKNIATTYVNPLIQTD